MIDVHCHLNFHAFEKDYDEVIKDAFEKGVKKIINVGTKIDSSEKAIKLAQKYDNLYATVGVHPHHADKPVNSHPERSEGSPDEGNGDSSAKPQNDNGEDWIDELEKLAKNPKVVGIGECGMDFYRYKSNGIVDPKLQKDIFIKQIELSLQLKLPLQIHNRHAGKEIIEILNHYKNDLLNPSGMFHCMSGDLELLKKTLDLGFYIGFDGNITYKGLAPGETTSLIDLVKETPIEKIVTETDAPFLAPEPYRGRRNLPSYVIITGQFIAGIKNIPFEKVEEQTSLNASRILNLV